VTPKKPTASEGTVMEFIQAIWPDFTEASLSLFTEESLLRDAINLIRDLRAVEVSAREVMDLLEKHGPSIVPHLLDDDENAGERLRTALRETRG
jgi:hypothetical protein